MPGRSALSTDRSIRLAMTMMRSKMFQPLEKYSLLKAISLRAASSAKNEVKTCRILMLFLLTREVPALKP